MKKMTRQILMCTASMTAVLALSACGKNNESAPEVPATPPPAATAATPATPPPANAATANMPPASSGTAMEPMHSSSAPPPAGSAGH
ncbi:MAG: hypothetical protein ACREPQ_15955 [Rhodanobacter sp.]